MKILCLDLECMPMMSYHFKRWKENVTLPQTVHESYLASWAAKWIGEDEVMYDGLNNYSMSMDDEKAVAATLWVIMNEADCIVTFNGDAFDVKVANTAFLRYGLKPVKPFVSTDLIKVLKKHFRLSSNSLKSALSFLGMENKQENDGWKLWIACCNKDKEAWKLMEEYNKQDVVVTENLYNRLLPWIHNGPNHNMHSGSETPVCPNCGSHNLTQPSGPVYTKTQMYRRYRCTDCGANSRGKKTLIPREKSATFLTKC